MDSAGHVTIYRGCNASHRCSPTQPGAPGDRKFVDETYIKTSHGGGGLESAVQDADEPVTELAQRGVAADPGGAQLVVVGAGSGSGAHGEHPGAEHDAQAGLAEVDLSVRVLTKASPPERFHNSVATPAQPGVGAPGCRDRRPGWLPR